MTGSVLGVGLIISGWGALTLVWRFQGPPLFSHRFTKVVRAHLDQGPAYP